MGSVCIFETFFCFELFVMCFYIGELGVSFSGGFGIFFRVIICEIEVLREGWIDVYF